MNINLSLVSSTLFVLTGATGLFEVLWARMSPGLRRDDVRDQPVSRTLWAGGAREAPATEDSREIERPCVSTG